MKTIRTIIGTLAGVLLTFALVAWFSVRRNAAFIQRTIYQGFDQTFVVALVMGCAFLLIAIILTVAIVSTDKDDEEDEEDDAPETFRPHTRPHAQSMVDRQFAPGRQPAFSKGEEPYRRVSRVRTMEQDKAADSAFVRPKAAEADKPAPRKREMAAEQPDDIAIRGEDSSAKKERKAIKTEPEGEVKLKQKRPKPEAEGEPRPRGKRPKPEDELETESRPRVKRPKPETEPGEKTTAKAAEATVRCVFCGSVIGRDESICPNCGKKR